MIDVRVRERTSFSIYSTFKRGLDIALAGSALLVLLPLMLAIAILVKFDSPGPVLFRQQRPGKGQQPFHMLKFRTMQDGSDKLSAAVLKDAGFGPLHKQAADPRITRVGHTLRRFSLDELPQLINVLRGEMSLVGPRPLLGWEFENRAEEERIRLSVRPGITGLWQVSGRSNLPFDEMLRLDLQYVSDQSLLKDVKIILATIPCVLKGDGAY